MFVTIWMCTQEWSLISSRTHGVHVRDVPPGLDLRVGVDVLEQRAAACGSRAPARGAASRRPPRRASGACRVPPRPRADRPRPQDPRSDVVAARLGLLERHVAKLTTSGRRRAAVGVYATSAAQSPYSRVYGAARGHQLVVRAALDDPAVVEHDDHVGAADRREPVRDDERRAAGEEHAAGRARSAARSRCRRTRSPRRG